MSRGRGRRLVRTTAALLCLAGIGLAAKYWPGPGRIWMQNSFAGLIYVAFWIVLAGGVWPRARSVRVAAIVFAITCLLETLQLWKPPWLEALRSTWLGKALIGTTFSWLDFPHYVAGAVVGALLARSLAARGGRDSALDRATPAL